jgi:hypothetical protein
MQTSGKADIPALRICAKRRHSQEPPVQKAKDASCHLFSCRSKSPEGRREAAFYVRIFCIARTDMPRRTITRVQDS